METRIFVAAAALCLCAAAQAQTAMTLHRCVEMALRNNVRMKNADNDVAMAGHDKAEALTGYFPQVGAAGAAFMANKGLVSLDMAPGQTFSMMKDGSMGSLTATMPVFAGGQIANGNRLAKVGLEVSRLQRNMSGNEVRLTTERYFWQVVKLKEKLRTIGMMEKQLSGIESDVENAVNAGLTTRNDLLQVRLRRNETESARISIENALGLAQALLAQYVGMPGDSVDADFTPPAGMPEPPQALYRNPSEQLPATPEYRLLEQQVKAGRLQYRMAVGKNLPQIAVGGGLSYYNLMGRDHTAWVGFATVSVPLSAWWGGSHSMKKHRLKVKNAENQMQDQSRMLLIRMRQAWNDLNDAYKQIQIAQMSVEQADENLRLQADYYAAGTSTMTDLLNAQALFQQSRDRHVEASTTYEVKKREYLQATGR